MHALRWLKSLVHRPAAVFVIQSFYVFDTLQLHSQTLLQIEKKCWGIFSTNPFCGDMQEEVNTCIFNLLNFVNFISFEQAHLVMISVIQSINELI